MDHCKPKEKGPLKKDPSPSFLPVGPADLIIANRVSPFAAGVNAKKWAKTLRNCVKKWQKKAAPKGAASLTGRK